ncbi:MAG: trehalose-6-phosphate synthase [Chloroflexi bacterium]|nr:MAG: trehalose-6-phosphate synthase [Chloroflexota bacterium]
MVPDKAHQNEAKLGRLVVVSNRLPISITRAKRGEWHVEPAMGGLVTALTPVLRERKGLWIGWPGIGEEIDPAELSMAQGSGLGYQIRPVMLSDQEVDEYYFGFSNEILWPLFHDLQNFCNFNPVYWKTYQAVNRKFAEAVAQSVEEDDYIWVHDYHLTLLARELKSLGLPFKVGFFLHTPFPSPDIFMKLPWRSQLLNALLEYDLLGFQTTRDRNNFIYCAEALIRNIHHDARRQVSVITAQGRRARVGAFPISIDFREYARQASVDLVGERVADLRRAIPDNQIILGVDRLDYSKGIPEKLKAFRYALERHDDLYGQVTLVQVVVPSREDIPRYQELRDEVEGLVSEINGQFTQWGWVPIHYMYRNLDRLELLAYYRAAEIALVTPLKDGMNLVAKEYCAANRDRNGVLILSEFAGSATQLRHSALLVNPYDIEGVANAIHRAYKMEVGERRARMRRLRKSIRDRDIFWWVESFLQVAAS